MLKKRNKKIVLSTLYAEGWIGSNPVPWNVGDDGRYPWTL